jgi:hypothetical protein
MKLKFLPNSIEIDGEPLELSTIIAKCSEAKVKEEKLVLLSLKWTRRNSDIYEKKAYPKAIAEKVKKMLLGREIYFGEIEGKHSEVYGTLDNSDMTIITNKKEVKEFIITNPDGWDYNHSFLSTHADRIQDDPTEDITEDYIREFLDIY